MARDSIRSRFDRYDRDVLEWQDLKARAERAGRTPGEQDRWEEESAARIAEQTRCNLFADMSARTLMLHGPGPYSRPDLFGEPQPVDPMEQDKWL